MLEFKEHLEEQKSISVKTKRDIVVTCDTQRSIVCMRNVDDDEMDKDKLMAFEMRKILNVRWQTKS